MNKNVAITVLLILGFLLIGFVVGFLTNGWLLRQRLEPIREMRTEAGFVQTMSDVMQLSPEQKLHTDSIFSQQFRKTQNLLREHRRTLKANMDSTLLLLKPYVTEQQLNELEKNRQKIRQFARGNLQQRPPRKQR